MSETFDPYCIYCDEGADGDHARCESLWEASERAPAYATLPTPTPPTHGASATVSFGANPMTFTRLNTDEVQRSLTEREEE